MKWKKQTSRGGGGATEKGKKKSRNGSAQNSGRRRTQNGNGRTHHGKKTIGGGIVAQGEQTAKKRGGKVQVTPRHTPSGGEKVGKRRKGREGGGRAKFDMGGAVGPGTWGRRPRRQWKGSNKMRKRDGLKKE